MTVRELDKVIVMGRSVPVQTYELIAEKGQEPDLYKELLPWNYIKNKNGI